MKKDNIFASKKDPVPPFEFNEEVTSVFDDMIKRSVPLYMESLKRQCQLIYRFYQPGTIIYDLGCSHGNLGVMIDESFKVSPGESNKKRTYTMIAVDSSQSMIEKYRNRLNDQIDNISLVCGPAEDIPISNASIVIVNLTMQFIKFKKRDQFIQGIYDGLNKGGILLLTEKITSQNMVVSEIHQDLYKKFKLENGYSELEISRKRDALENILIPESIEDHIKRLYRAGFETMDVWLKWFNFASMIAIK